MQDSTIVFGPINSRRFGMSLGIDLSPKQKSCNFDCVYCELKGAKPVEEIENPPSIDGIISALKEALKVHQNIDVITLTANGEPTLYPHLKELIVKVDELKGRAKTLILSNGSGVRDQKICEALQGLDIVKFSLDSAVQSTFKKIDRNKSGIEINELIKAMAKFRKEFKGELVLEILVVAGFNDKEEEFMTVNEAINEIAPHRVDVGTIDRPPAYNVKGVDASRLEELASKINGVPVTIARAHKIEQKYEFSKSEILAMLERRPQTTANVEENFSEHSKQILNKLLQDGAVYQTDVAGVKFYKLR
ncbi:radical SAM protein [Campylobacter concisus]|uniref:radical SAM protein n=1 Tax=Campylobacter concisus TaxID=199 RepID=UPI000CD868BB|nr:radical SAM protein [Campylobacter concisus]MCA6130551.1 radical SAM protein [Campylobacter concisus]MCA6132610.1 radical SAM protein [Campylobacter concisus]